MLFLSKPYPMILRLCSMIVDFYFKILHIPALIAYPIIELQSFKEKGIVE
ncbi:hypothetical protein SAMN04487996_11330 [Dyadobacter soli]|uniref:Uncharacterized protein n=1 Tax=Dyadobacter soli TaxID=659014 RepID=A0A1G7PJD5_9BACT|nr:hypothetical protein SAMN04487996_11330 [Dyadobacter soli]